MSKKSNTRVSYSAALIYTLKLFLEKKLYFFPHILSCEFSHGGYELFWIILELYFGYKFEKKAKNLGKFEFFSKLLDCEKKNKPKKHGVPNF